MNLDPRMLRAPMVAFMIFAAGSAVWISLLPIHSFLSRLLFLASLGIFSLSLLVLLRKKPAGMITFAALIFCGSAFLMLPGRSPDISSLREKYLQALKSYDHTPYVWGGEQHSGIDCSGLPRKALRDALFTEGFRTFNPSLTREALLQWWYDASAKSLSEGYRNSTIPLTLEGTIRSLDYSALHPGDIAVTKSGTHCLVYVDGNQWIQADPAGAVVLLDGKTAPNEWFNAPVAMHRWRVLE